MESWTRKILSYILEFIIQVIFWHILMYSKFEICSSKFINTLFYDNDLW